MGDFCLSYPWEKNICMGQEHLPSHFSLTLINIYSSLSFPMYYWKNLHASLHWSSEILIVQMYHGVRILMINASSNVQVYQDPGP